MLDLKAIRDNPDAFRAALQRRGAADALASALDLDQRLRDLKTQVEALRAEQNRASKEIGRAVPDERQAKIDAVGALSQQLKDLEPRLQQTQDELDQLLLRIPNVPHESVPDGLTDEDNVLVKEVGKGGIVREPEKHERVVREINEFAGKLGLACLGVIESPILGAEGNKEFLSLYERAK